MNEEIQAAQTRFDVFDHTPLGICIVDSSFTTLFWNVFMEEWTGILRNEILGESLTRFFPHFKSPTYFRRLDDIFRGGPPTVFSSQLHQQVFKPINYPDYDQIQHATVTALPAEQSGKWYAMFSVKDVTDITKRINDFRSISCKALKEISNRKKIENELRESEKKFRNLTETLPQTIFEIDTKGIISYINSSGMELFGLTQNDLKQKVSLFDFISKDDLEKFSANLEIIAKYNITKGFEYTAKKKNLITFSVMIYATPLFSDKTCHGFRGVILDISLLKRAEEEALKLNRELEARVADRTNKLNEAMQELKDEIKVRKYTESELQKAKEEISQALTNEKELSEMKTRFISMISHEYRTPLTVILSSTYLIERFSEEQNVSKVSYHLNKVRDSVKEMTNLLEDVLTIGKTNNKNLRLNLEKIDLEKTCDNIIENFKSINETGHVISYQKQGELNSVVLDSKLLTYILNNLITNAIKFSTAGSVIRVELKEGTGKIYLNVSDEGIGIPDEDQQNLFDPFFRARNSRETSGTGLGLAIVKQCVESLKGDISFTSKLNQGTSFSITLPKDLSSYL